MLHINLHISHLYCTFVIPGVCEGTDKITVLISRTMPASACWHCFWPSYFSSGRPTDQLSIHSWSRQRRTNPPEKEICIPKQTLWNMMTRKRRPRGNFKPRICPRSLSPTQSIAAAISQKKFYLSVARYLEMAPPQGHNEISRSNLQIFSQRSKTTSMQSFFSTLDCLALRVSSYMSLSVNFSFTRVLSPS